MNRLRVAIVGATHYHVDDWVAAVTAHPDAELVGVWDRDPVRSAQLASASGTAVLPDRAAALAAADVAMIASATAHHADDAIAAADAGCHILLEKPPVAAMADLVELRAAVERSGVTFAQNLPKRLDPASVLLRDLVRGGSLGPIATLRLRHGHAQAWDETFRTAWFTDPVLAGGGALLDEGIHTLDFARWLLGEPIAVTASISSVAGLRVEDTAVIGLELPGGALASITTSWSFAGADGSVELHGRDASVLVGGVDMASRGLSGTPLVRRVDRLPTPRAADRRFVGLDVEPAFSAGGFHGLGVRDLLDAIVDERPPAAGLDDAEAALALVGAAYESVRTGARITLPDRKASR